jgi:hypothetical protein
MKIRIGKLKTAIAEALNPPTRYMGNEGGKPPGFHGLPPLKQAEQVVWDEGLGGGYHSTWTPTHGEMTPGPSRMEYKTLLNRLKEIPGAELDVKLLDQYVQDAQLDDDDDQKEGNDSQYYVDLALEELQGIYKNFGPAPTPGKKWGMLGGVEGWWKTDED